MKDFCILSPKVGKLKQETIKEIIKYEDDWSWKLGLGDITTEMYNEGIQEILDEYENKKEVRNNNRQTGKRALNILAQFHDTDRTYQRDEFRR